MKSKDRPLRDEKLIACFTGMPGAGKSTAAKAAEDMGFEVVNMGDGVREETVRRGLPLTDKNVGAVMIDLRRRSGMGAVAHLALPKIRSSKSLLVAVDGVRNLEEVEVFREAGLVRILAIHAAPEVRFRFLGGRDREDAPKSWKLFEERDEREISVGVGSVMALADDIISNNGISIEGLKEETRKVLSRWVGSIER
ncbi:MAG: AAA family ATPase [Nitrososphaerales archaeon]